MHSLVKATSALRDLPPGEHVLHNNYTVRKVQSYNDIAYGDWGSVLRNIVSNVVSIAAFPNMKRLKQTYFRTETLQAIKILAGLNHQMTQSAYGNREKDAEFAQLEAAATPDDLETLWKDPDWKAVLTKALIQASEINNQIGPLGRMPSPDLFQYVIQEDGSLFLLRKKNTVSDDALAMAILLHHAMYAKPIANVEGLPTEKQQLEARLNNVLQATSWITNHSSRIDPIDPNELTTEEAVAGVGLLVMLAGLCGLLLSRRAPPQTVFVGLRAALIEFTLQRLPTAAHRTSSRSASSRRRTSSRSASSRRKSASSSRSRSATAPSLKSSLASFHDILLQSDRRSPAQRLREATELLALMSFWPHSFPVMQWCKLVAHLQTVPATSSSVAVPMELPAPPLLRFLATRVTRVPAAIRRVIGHALQTLQPVDGGAVDLAVARLLGQA
eukprot:gene11640-13054_t